MNSDIWQIENNICRCCHADGVFHNLAEPRLYCGDNEIYADMLKDYLNIEIRPVPGTLGESTYNICSLCITKLRQAIQFKKQVQSCEKRFMDLYLTKKIRALENSCSNVTVVKEEQEYATIDLKEEYLILEDNDSNNEVDNTDLDFDVDDVKSENEEELLVTKKRKAKGKREKKEIKITIKKEPQKIQKETARKRELQLKKQNETIDGKNFTVTIGGDGAKRYTCAVCQHVYERKNRFTQHYKNTHLKRRTRMHKCHLCDIKCTGYQRAYHMEQAHGLPPPTCNACGKKFAFPYHVLRHQRAFHMGEKVHACGTCDWKFSTRTKLRVHEAKHDAERSYTCHVCDKRFKWKKNLVLHVKIHRNERSHVCPVCGEAFVQRSSLKYHTMRKHPDIV